MFAPAAALFPPVDASGRFRLTAAEEVPLPLCCWAAAVGLVGFELAVVEMLDNAGVAEACCCWANAALLLTAAVDVDKPLVFSLPAAGSPPANRQQTYRE